MHRNSLEALKQITKDGTKETRLNKVFACCKVANKPLRDWDILKILFPEKEDLNLVRPRITELHMLNLLAEGPRMKNNSGTRKVRSSVIYSDTQVKVDF